MRLRTLKTVREAPSPTTEQCHQVYIYEYLLANTQFPFEKWIIADYPIAQASEAYRFVGAFLEEHFCDPNDRGTPALIQGDVEAVRQEVSRKMEQKSRNDHENGTE